MLDDLGMLLWPQYFVNWLRPQFEILVNTDISVLGFYGYIENIGGYFKKNIGKVKIIQNSWKYLEKLQKKMIK